MEDKKYFQKLEIVPEDGLSIGDLVSYHYYLLEYLRDFASPLAQQNETLRIGLWYLTFRCRTVSNCFYRESKGTTENGVEKMLQCYPELAQYHTPQAGAVAPFDLERMMSEAADGTENVLRHLTDVTEERQVLVNSFLEFVTWCRTIKEMVGENWFVRVW